MMNDLPFWAYAAMTFGGLLICAGAGYLMANSKRNNPVRREKTSVVVENGTVMATGVMSPSVEFTLDVLKVAQKKLEQASASDHLSRDAKPSNYATAENARKL